MKLANTLTKLSNNYVDWSRTGDLFFSGLHRYNIKQTAVRAAMLITTATAAYLGAALNNPAKTNQSDIVMAVAAGMLGMIVSHIFVIAPLIHKRYAQNQACKKLIDDIYHSIQENPGAISVETVKDVIESILNHTLQDDKHSNASMTWGLRRRMLSTFDALLKNRDEALISILSQGNIHKVLDTLKQQLSHQTNEPLISLP